MPGHMGANAVAEATLRARNIVTSGDKIRWTSPCSVDDESGKQEEEAVSDVFPRSQVALGNALVPEAALHLPPALMRSGINGSEGS